MRHILAAVFAIGILFAAGAVADSQVAGNLQTPKITNCSGTITTGGTAQKIITFSSTAPIHFIQIQNQSIDLMAFSEALMTTTPAVSTNNAWTLNPSSATTAGGSYTSPTNYVPTSDVWINAATTGDKFTCVWW